MVELNLEVLEVVSGGWGFYAPKPVKSYTNNSTITLKNFGVNMLFGIGNTGVGISVSQTINA
jgi:hypothetical protein